MTITADHIYSYVLPGQVADPTPMFDQAAAAQAHGMGGIFLSERWESKELGACLGALSHATEKLMLVAGLTHFGTRHPIVQAGLAQTLQMLSGGRFVLGYGRGVPPQFKKLGIPVPNMQGMIDYTRILRGLWNGETIRYSGPAGDYPEMQLAHATGDAPPIIIGTIGSKTLVMAGTHFDGVVLHPFLTVEGVRKSIEVVRNAASEAGRDPASVKIYATVVTAPDTISAESRTDMVDARAVSYFMHRDIGRQLIHFNGWDEAPLQALAETDLAASEFAAGDVAEKRRRMAQAVELLPSHWLTNGAATGPIGACVSRLSDYVAAGADYILLHGTTPDQQSDIIHGLETS